VFVGGKDIEKAWGGEFSSTSRVFILFQCRVLSKLRLNERKKKVFFNQSFVAIAFAGWVLYTVLLQPQNLPWSLQSLVISSGK
jgi:hypothetical protein